MWNQCSSSPHSAPFLSLSPLLIPAASSSTRDCVQLLKLIGVPVIQVHLTAHPLWALVNQGPLSQSILHNELPFLGPKHAQKLMKFGRWTRPGDNVDILRVPSRGLKNGSTVPPRTLVSDSPQTQFRLHVWNLATLTLMSGCTEKPPGSML